MKVFKAFKSNWKVLMGKCFTLIGALGLVFTPVIASAKSPAEYINGFTTGIFGQILSIAPNVVLVVIGFALIMYKFGGDRTKDKWKSTAINTFIAFAILLALRSLIEWGQGFFN